MKFKKPLFAKPMLLIFVALAKGLGAYAASLKSFYSLQILKMKMDMKID